MKVLQKSQQAKRSCLEIARTIDNWKEFPFEKCFNSFNLNSDFIEIAFCDLISAQLKFEITVLDSRKLHDAINALNYA